MVGSGSILELFFFGLAGGNCCLFGGGFSWLIHSGAALGELVLAVLLLFHPERGKEGWVVGGDAIYALGTWGISSIKSKSHSSGRDAEEKEGVPPPWVPGTNPRLTLRGGVWRKSGGSEGVYFSSGRFTSFKVEQIFLAS